MNGAGPTLPFGTSPVAANPLALIVEGDPAEGARLSQGLEATGYDTELAADGLAGLRQFFNSHPDVVVLSLDVTKLPGWDLVERIRTLAGTPIVITSSEATVGSLQRGFDLQVDAFLVKPFEIEELVARLNAVRERKTGESGRRGWLFQRNGLTIDWRSCEVHVRGKPVRLTSTEFKLLSYLVQRKGWVLSHDQILSEVWGPEYVGEKDRVKLYVWYLRQKIEEDPSHPKLILTKRGLGYTFSG